MAWLVYTIGVIALFVLAAQAEEKNKKVPKKTVTENKKHA